MNAHDLFRAGKIDEAIDAMNAEVRAHPSDPDRRAFLADLLCTVGNFERADIQLDAIAKVVPGSVPTVALVRQLIRAEQWRQQCFREGRVPEFLSLPGEPLQASLRALVALREGDVGTAAELLSAVEEQRRPLAGICNGAPFDDIRDVDDLSSSFFEVLTSTGKYYWIPMEHVIRVELRPLERARDLIWRRAGMEVRGGPDGEVFLPAIYAPAPTERAACMGRVTEWSEVSPVRGTGLRTFLVGDEPLTLPEIRELTFETQGT